MEWYEVDRITERQLCQLLQQRREAVATRLYESIARGSFVQLDPASVQQQVLELTDRAISLLVAEPFVAGEARAMGVALAELRYLPPEAFGCTLEVLARELVGGLPLDVLVPLQSRLASLLGEFAVGFLKAWHGAILMEQDRIHRALLAAQREAEEARRASEARYQTVAAQVAEGIVLIDPGTARIVDANPACHHMLGDQEEELCGLALYDLAALDPATIEEGIQQTLQEGRRKVGPRLCWRKDGSLATVKADAAVIATGSDPILSVVVHEVGERGREADSALSEHEWQLLARLAAGLSNRQIADELNLGNRRCATT